MAYVAADASLRQPSVTPEAVYARFAGRPLQGWEEPFLSLAARYQVDPNWAISYLQWESGFGGSAVGRANPTNPWGILCYSGQWGQVGEYEPGNGYCYAVYPDVQTGLEAGFRLWSSYADQGYTDWFSSLSRAQCGNAAGCGNAWASNVIRTGQQNAERWPADGWYQAGPVVPPATLPPAPPVPTPPAPSPAPSISPVTGLAAALAVVVAILVLWSPEASTAP